VERERTSSAAFGEMMEAAALRTDWDIVIVVVQVEGSRVVLRREEILRWCDGGARCKVRV